MRLRLFGIAAATAFVIAAMVGPFGAAAAGPYVYSCDPGSPSGGGNNNAVYLYNGQATTANVTFRVLTANGTNITAGLGLPSTFTVAPTNTKVMVYVPPPGLNSSFTWDPQNVSTTVATLRIVSDVALGVGVNLFNGGDHNQPCPLIVV
jgi:hypothetical protein